MQPYTRAGGGKRIVVGVRELRRDCAGEDVAGAGGREPGVAAGVHANAAGGGDDRRRSLEHDGGGAALARRPRLVEERSGNRAEQRLELASMRREDHRMPPPAQCVGIEQVECVAVDHQRAFVGVDQRVEARACPVVATEAGADQDRADPPVRERSIIEGTVDERVGSALPAAAVERDIACAAAQRRDTGEPRGAFHRSGDDRHHTAGVFVRVGAGFGQRRVVRHDSLASGGKTEIDEPDGAAHARAGLEHVRRLERAEREREGDGVSERPLRRLAAVGVDAARQVGGNRDPRGSGEPGERCIEIRVERTRHAGAEQTVDQHRRRHGGVQRLYGSHPFGCGTLRGCGARRGAGGEADGEAGFCQRGGGDITATAVVARTAQHEHLRAGREASDGGGNPLARGAHQRIHGGPCGDRVVLRCAHRGGGEDRPSLNGQHDTGQRDYEVHAKTRSREEE